MKHKVVTVLALVSVTSLVVAGRVGLANDNWTSFQNGGKLGVTNESNIPEKWAADSNIKWSVPLKGYGQSSPVFDGKLLYVTSVKGGMKDELVIEAKNIETGQNVWEHVFKNSTPEKNTTYVSRAAPTPVCDEDGVIAFFEGGNLIAFTSKGDKRWELDLVEKYGPIKARHGLASSLEQNDANVFVWVERQEDPYVLAIEKNSGKLVWRSGGLGVSTWSSPRLISVGKSQHLVLSGIGKIAGYDPVTGKQLWTFDKIAGNSTPTPIPVGDSKFLIGASTGRGESTSGKAAHSNGLIEVTEKDGKFRADFVWKAETATSTFGSPLAHNGHAYFVNRSGVLFCLDLKTGKEVYAGRTKSSVWATPLGIGSKVYLFGKDGNTTVIDSGESFKKLAVNTLWKATKQESSGRQGAMNFGGPVLYSGVLIGNAFVLRRGDRLYCVENN